MLVIYGLCGIITIIAFIWGLCHKTSEENELKVFNICAYCTLTVVICGIIYYAIFK